MILPPGRVLFLFYAGVVRRQAQVGPQRVRGGRGDLRPLRDHLAARHHPLQQVSVECRVMCVVLYSILVNKIYLLMTERKYWRVTLLPSSSCQSVY